MRVFVAVDLPEHIQAALAESQARFRTPESDCRWTRPGGIHLTLKFLGEISADQVRKVSDALRAIGGFESFTVEVRGFGFFPDARRPRVFWAGLEAPPALAELAARVEGAMETLGSAPEGRPFRAHLTLARFKIPRAPTALQDMIEKERDTSLGRFEVSEFFLYESRLSPGAAAEYRKLERFPR